MSNNVMTLASLRKYATGSRALTDQQYTSGTATVADSALSARASLVLVAYAVKTRCIAGTSSDGSMGRLAADTKPDGLQADGWRTTVGKHATTGGYLVTAGVVDTIDAAGIDLVFRGHDSTKEGRALLAKAAKAAAGKPDALAILLDAAEAAVALKAAARKAGESSKRGGQPDDGSKAAGQPDSAPAAPVTVQVTWLQMLAGIADAAPAEASALDASALAKATALVASIADSIADADATMRAALATARSRKTSK